MRSDARNSKPRLFNCFCKLFVFVLVVCWVLAIAKVFIIDQDEIVISVGAKEKTTHTQPIKISLKQPASPLEDVDIQLKLNNKMIDTDLLRENENIHLALPRFSEWTQFQLAPHKDGLSQGQGLPPIPPMAPLSPGENSAAGPRAGLGNAIPDPPPLIPDMAYKQQPAGMERIRDAAPAVQIGKQQRPPLVDSNSAAAPNALGANGLLPPHKLAWPPVQLDQLSTLPEEGFDIMPMTGLKVPRFWMPEENPADPSTSMYRLGSHVNGEPTIFLMIASYRDFQCRETITSAYMRSDHPERLFVGAVDQVVPGDVGCLDIDIPCSEDPTQMICKYKDQISVYKMDAQYATGPVSARHIGDRMYRGQYFVMQMDAHCLFINHWDTKLIGQWRSTLNELAVLSSYLTDVQGSIDANGDSRRKTRPIMCNSDFEGLMPQRYLRHGSQPEDFSAIPDMPQLQPFWAAGFSFSRGHFKVQVPYDGYQPMVFQGEEIAIGIRGFTYGYDFYAPRDSVVFHEYAEKSSRRKKIHMFWENSEKHRGEGQKSLKRSMAVIGMAPDLDPTTWDHSETSKYGLGTGRELTMAVF